jgi:hypothetical protein
MQNTKLVVFKDWTQSLLSLACVLYIQNMNKFIGLYDFKYFSTTMLISLNIQNAFDK